MQTLQRRTRQLHEALLSELQDYRVFSGGPTTRREYLAVGQQQWFIERSLDALSAASMPQIADEFAAGIRRSKLHRFFELPMDLPDGVDGYCFQGAGLSVRGVMYAKFPTFELHVRFDVLGATK